MRHRNQGKKLGRTTAHRKALRRNLAIAIFTHGRIMTTVPKAKSVRPFVERLITLGKKCDAARLAGDQPRYLHCYRRAISILNDPQIAKKLVDEIAPGYRDRPGGYTRILRDATNRLGDNAPKAVFELVALAPPPDEGKKKKKRGRRRKAKAGAS